MTGVNIGDNVIIGAHSLVSKDIPSGHVAAGVPAILLKTVEEYWAEKKNFVVMTRSKPRSEKRKFLMKRFNLSG